MIGGGKVRTRNKMEQDLTFIHLPCVLQSSFKLEFSFSVLLPDTKWKGTEGKESEEGTTERKDLCVADRELTDDLSLTRQPTLPSPTSVPQLSLSQHMLDLEDKRVRERKRINSFKV